MVVTSGQQFGRKANLVVSAAANGLDLSQMHFRFEVRAADLDTPNTAIIRVYNLSQSTRDRIIKEFDTVTLQAGYAQGNFGIIFQGTIKQIYHGRERNVDNFLEIRAADGDIFHNFGFINKSFPGGMTDLQKIQAVSAATGNPIDQNVGNLVTLNRLPRGKVMFGLVRAYMRDIARTNDSRWSIQNGAITLVPLTGYLPGKAIVVNSNTGMIGVPEATENGIAVTVLLNPLIHIGHVIKINNRDITQTQVKEQIFPSYTSSPTFLPSVTDDGLYRVLVAEHTGDTRGQEWYTQITCLSVEPEQPIDQSVAAFG